MSCEDAAPRRDLPLVALLGQAHDRFEAEFDRRITATPFCALSLAHARNVLRHLGDTPRRASSFIADCGVTKQAVSQQIAHLESNGYVKVVPDPADHRARLLSLTAKGRRAQRAVEQLLADIEADWSSTLGAATLAELRATLIRSLDGA